MNKTLNIVLKLFKLSILSTLVIGIFTVICFYIIKTTTANQIYSSVENIPKNKVGLLLGTSKKISSTQLNLYFKYRIEAAVTLYQAGKIEYILVSGDNSTKYYNETKDMKEALLAKGIPEAKIVMDFAGLRTLDSVIRAYEIFGQDKYTIISQEFHNERALFIANFHSINAIALNAKDVNINYGLKTKIREVFARVKAVLDIFVLDKQPKFLGEKIKI